MEIEEKISALGLRRDYAAINESGSDLCLTRLSRERNLQETNLQDFNGAYLT